MKNFKYFGMLLAVSLALPLSAQAKQIMELGPHGGRLMQAGKLKVEFHLDKERKAHVYLYDQGLKPVGADGAQVTLKILKGGTKKVEMAKAPSDPKEKGSASHLVGKSAMPSPDGYLVVLNVKTPGKPIDSLRFNFQESVCGGCKAQEYACICGH
jgi:hypothetical protein